MKAFLLAAGKGTRLRPVTNNIPKCLVPVSGRPLIEYWFDLFERYGINEVLINTSYLADRVQEYLKKIDRNIKIQTTYEKTLLGSGGTIKKNWAFVKNEEMFFIFYADNLTNLNIAKLIDFHTTRRKEFTLALFKVQNPQECGIVELDENSNVVSFEEKPSNPASDLAFAGILLSSIRLRNYFPEQEIFDLGYDVLPGLVDNASGYIVDEYLIDIGTPEKLKQAEKDIKNGKINQI
jgi:mannose-1-phosphate guanylyltransferase